MNVGSAFSERVGHDGVDKLDDRGFIDESLTCKLVIVLALEDLYVVVVVDFGEQVLHLCFAGRIELLDGVAKRELPGNDGKNIEAGDEFDVIEH